MLKTFDCPKCGAPVSYEQDVIGANLTARCTYCNSALSVPDEMRGRPAQIISQVNIDLRNSGTKATKIILLIVLILGFRFAPPQALRCRPLRGLKLRYALRCAKYIITQVRYEFRT